MLDHDYDEDSCLCTSFSCISLNSLLENLWIQWGHTFAFLVAVVIVTNRGSRKLRINRNLLTVTMVGMKMH